MKESNRLRFLILLSVVLVISAIATILWIRARRETAANIAVGQKSAQQAPTVPTPLVIPSPTSTPTPTPAADVSPLEPGLSTPSPGINPPANSFVGQMNLIIPVTGVRPDQLIDTFAAARSEGRSHDAIDIAAPAGTPVVAASEGEIVKLFQSEKGGTTIYQLSPDKKLVYYYAHLQRYADGIQEGKYARQGEVIGYVGDTGNAGAGNFHLHFSIAAIADPNRHWEGTNINPYPLLKKQ